MTATLCLTIDNLGAAIKVGRGLASRPDPEESGLRTGLPNALALLADLDLTATFFIEGWNVLHHSDAITRIVNAGHEVGTHGWVHEPWAELTDQDRERLLYDATAAYQLLGVRPRGFRAPGGYRGDNTPSLLLELGYSYDSSIDHETEDEPIAPRVLHKGLPCIPWHWDANDFCQFLGHPRYLVDPSPVAIVEARWRESLDDAIQGDALWTLTLHPFVTFVDEQRIRLVRALLEHALDRGVSVVSAEQLILRMPEQHLAVRRRAITEVKPSPEARA